MRAVGGSGGPFPPDGQERPEHAGRSQHVWGAEFAALQAKLEQSPVSLPTADAVTRFGPGEAADAPGAPGREAALALAEQAERTDRELDAVFDAVLDGTVDDLEVLDRLVTEGWAPDRPPEPDDLLHIALDWGALVGERVIASVGGHWVVRPDPLHTSLRFPRGELEFFPAHAVLARFLVGPEAGLEAGYHHLVEYLVSR